VVNHRFRLFHTAAEQSLSERATGTVNDSKVLMWLLIAIGGVIVVGVLWLSGAVIVPFFVAFLLAYLLHPTVDFLEARGVPRGVAAAGLISVLMLGIVSIGMWLGPLLYEQMQAFAENARAIVVETASWIRRLMTPYLPALREVGLDGLVTQKAAPGAALAQPITVSLLNQSMDFVTQLGLAMLTPLIAFYLLNDWERMNTSVIASVPRRHRGWVRELALEIDNVLSRYLRGQAWVCAGCAVLYSTGLLISGLNYALLIGVISGLLKFMPYIGTAIAIAIAVSVAVVQSQWDGLLLVSVIGVYAVVEMIESGVLTPKLIGESIHLPPALVIFAALVGGKLMGVIGVFVALPLCAVVRVAILYWRRMEHQWDNVTPAPRPAVRPRADQPPTNAA